MKMSSVKPILAAFLCVAVISAARGDSDRRQTRPKMMNDGDTASQLMAVSNSASEEEAAASQFVSRTRPKRFFEISRPKRSQETDKTGETIEGLLKRMQLITDLSRMLDEDRSSKRQEDTKYMVIKLWEEFCSRDNLRFDRQSVSCVQDGGNVPDTRGWGNPGGVPGK